MKKKVFLIVGVLKDGGAQRAASNISLALEERYDISFVTFSAAGAVYPHGGTLYDLQLPRRKGRFSALWNDLMRARALGRLKKELQPDVCISFLQDANFANVLSRGVGKTVVSLRTYLSARSMGRMAQWQTRFSYGKADDVICVSQASMEDLVRRGLADRRRCAVIPNMVNGPELLSSASRTDIPVPESRPLLATMGSLTAQKGMWNLLRVFRDVLERYPNAQLLLLGGGNQAPYRALSRQLGIDPHVTFAGFVVDPHALLAKADLFVFPSRFEGMPNALLEAMALGLPVISTDCPSGPREILAPGTAEESVQGIVEFAEFGILVPVPRGGFLGADAAQTAEEGILLEAICAMLGDEHLRKSYAAASLERAAAYSPDRISAMWSDHIDGLIG